MPQWLVYLLTGSLFVSALCVSMFAWWTADAFINQPVNPLGGATLGNTQNPDTVIILHTATPSPDAEEPAIVLVEEESFPTPDPVITLRVAVCFG